MIIHNPSILSVKNNGAQIKGRGKRSAKGIIIVFVRSNTKLILIATTIKNKDASAF